MSRIAMITGAAKNTGWATAQRFAQEGYDVIITSRKKEEAQAAAEKLMEEYPQQKAWGVKMGMDTVAAIREGFQQVAGITSRLDVFVANAASLGVGVDIFTATEETYDAVMNVNAKGTFFCCQEAIKLMGEGSAICLISSIQSKKAVTGRTVYSSSKGAMNALMRSLALELAYLGIRVNAIIAGAIHSAGTTSPRNSLHCAAAAILPAAKPCRKRSLPASTTSALIRPSLLRALS